MILSGRGYMTGFGGRGVANGYLSIRGARSACVTDYMFPLQMYIIYNPIEETVDCF